jgi:hypothetical protein
MVRIGPGFKEIKSRLAGLGLKIKRDNLNLKSVRSGLSTRLGCQECQECQEC